MKKLRVLSWGVGLQSTTLLEMSTAGKLPRLDVAIFADTGYEHDYTQDVYEFYAPRAKQAGIEVVKIGGQDILADQYQKVSVPLFVAHSSGRMTKRKCTRDYKIRPIQRKIRELLGVNQKGRLAPHLVELWLGITTDEIQRAKPSRVAYIDHVWPLLDLGLRRGQCETYLKKRGLPVPKKSSCKFCPFQQGHEWEQKTDQDIHLITDLENHINEQGLVKIGGQQKEVWFLAKSKLSGGNFHQPKWVQLEMCDGGFCNA